MASSITYPDKHVMWWIVGDNLAIATNLKSGGATRSGRKEWQASVEAVSGGVLIHYYAEPTAIDDIDGLLEESGLDNSLHLFVVDYVKSRLFMDKAAQSTDAAIVSSSLNLSNTHERSWKDALVKFGNRKREKVGGSRIVRPFDFR